MKENKILSKPYLGFYIICLVCIWVYSSIISYDFTNLDDQVQIVKNSNIRSLSFENISAIFSSTSVGMYQPISTIFYAVVYSVSELNPGGFHILSLLFHLLNCLLVLKILSKFKINESLAILLTSLFALHPMQVESVSWLSAFSNLCFTFFFLLAFLSYLKFSKSKSKKDYLLTLLFFIFSAFSKSTAVVFPVIIIAYDFIILKNKLIKSVITKIPLFVISIVFGIITIFSRESAGHLSDLSISYSWFDRFFLISHSILFYPLKFIAPINLSAFYAYPELSDGFLPISYYLAPIVILIITGLILKFKPKRIVLFGLAFYLIGIALVLQFIPVGNQLTTDRYIYLPMIGLLIALSNYLKKLPQQLVLALFLIPIGLSLLSFERTKIWENDYRLWIDVLDKNERVAQAHNNLGSYVLQQGKSKEAMAHFNRAIEIKPYYADAYSNRGSLFSDLGNSKKAMEDLNQAIELRPHADAYYNRANEFIKLKDLNSALADYDKSIELLPSADAYTNRAFAYAQSNQLDRAFKDLSNAIKLDNTYGQAFFLRGMIYNQTKKKTLACEDFKRAAKLNHEKAQQAYNQLCR